MNNNNEPQEQPAEEQQQQQQAPPQGVDSALWLILQGFVGEGQQGQATQALANFFQQQGQNQEPPEQQPNEPPQEPQIDADALSEAEKPKVRAANFNDDSVIPQVARIPVPRYAEDQVHRVEQIKL